MWPLDRHPWCSNRRSPLSKRLRALDVPAVARVLGVRVVFPLSKGFRQCARVCCFTHQAGAGSYLPRVQDEAWRKEAVVLWEYADKLAAAWDRRRVELRRSPGASGPSVCPGFGQALRNTRTASAAAAGHACGAALIVSSSVSRDPAWKGGRRMSSPPANRARAGSLNPTDRQIAAVATPCALEEETAASGTCRSGWPPRGAAERPLPGPLDARGLSQVLGAVNAVETYLYCTGRMKHLPESAPAVAADVREGSGDGANDAAVALRAGCAACARHVLLDR